MDRYEVIISTEASTDLAAIHAYIIQDSPQNADEVLDRLLSSIANLDLMPQRFKVHQRGNDARRMVRSMPVPPFVVYYRVVEDEHVVRILTVRRGTRRKPRRFD